MCVWVVRQNKQETSSAHRFYYGANTRCNTTSDNMVKWWLTGLSIACQQPRACGWVNTAPEAWTMNEGLRGLSMPRQRPWCYGWVNTAPEPQMMMMRNKAACSQRQREILSGLHFALLQALKPAKHSAIVSDQIGSKLIRKAHHCDSETARRRRSIAHTR